MYQPTIGLEIHVELKTKTKMFCDCLNDPEEKHPNINICPICLGHPGTLPTINKKAVESVLKLGLALNSKILEISKFDRKNYFYPDLPKGYQISQYDAPLCLGGYLEIPNFKTIKLRRIHLEEDTARLLHLNDEGDESLKIKNQKLMVSLIDFNRAGVPLMELVTEPEIESGKEATAFAKELKLILRYLDISDADMEKGQLRVEANISLSKSSMKNGEVLGTKVEIKNLNSFRAVEEAIDYEIKRQAEILEKGEKIKQETRGWDESRKKTVPQRFKEESHDYRYFPEPDLPILWIRASQSEFLNSTNQGSRQVIDFEKLKSEIQELPAQKRIRFVEEYGLTPNQVEILVEDRDFARYFEEAVSELKSELPITNYQLLFNYLSSDLRGLMNEYKITTKELNITPENFADLIILIERDEISSRLAKDILKEMFLTGLDPNQIIKNKGLTKISDNNILNQIIKEVIKENPKVVKDYKKGQENAIQFLIGEAMKKTKGQANPQLLREMFKKTLELL